ncbi:MAG: SAM-dependent methyltransferase [Rhodothermaceae bacterium]|nr:SAM-dependent methyltransferase [Rhodothermaceae bacterium]
MPLTWNEIKTRAAAFVHEWKDEGYEKGEAQTFWNQFLNVFGVSRRRVGSFEQGVKKLSGRQGFIDLLWPGVLLVEHKSRGEDLTAAEGQALDYFPGLKDEELPRYVLVSDFARFRLYDLEAEPGTEDHVEFGIEELLDHVSLFGFMAGYEKRTYGEQDPVNVKAARQMAGLHDALEAAGYRGHDLEVMLVRLLFCLFADDTGIFSPRGAFEDFLRERTRADGGDLGPMLGALFQTLDTAPEDRQTNLDEALAAFPYVNGSLFAGPLRTAAFDSGMRERLLEACVLDWGGISPAIFGSLFQGVMDPEERRELGAHYTSETNILKLIGPLFLDEMREELRKAGTNRAALARFHDRLAAFRLVDPACGCGNFLVVAYRELRRLEIEVIRGLYARDLAMGLQVLNVADLIRVDVDQCFGIEIEEFPAQIAQTALWLVDHQMNLEVAAAFGEYFTRLPLTSRPHVLNGNALTLDWGAAWGEAQPEAFDVILGNPPFIGGKYQSAEQKRDLKAVLHGIQSAGLLDFVTGWFVKAARYMDAHPKTRTAFVATNSISQGEQVGVLWNELMGEHGCRIHFAHRPFQWTNQASGKAAVHVVIEGFGPQEVSPKRLFDYEDIRGEPTERVVTNINPYLVEAADVVVLRRSTPLCDVPEIGIGNKPIDGGHYLFTPEEKAAFLEREPNAAPYFRQWIGAREFLNGVERWVLWLGDTSPAALRAMPAVMERVEAVRDSREQSKSAPTQRLAATPTRFHVENVPTAEFLVIPEVSSERRDYIPIGYLTPDVFASNKLRVFPNASLYHFGVLSSAMHMAWMRYTAGRMKSDYSYSITVVYNNFPWPSSPSASVVGSVEPAAEAVLAARAPLLASGSTLADLYDPLAMPRALVQAHRALDRAVDKAYRGRKFDSESERVAFLFDRYEALSNPLGVASSS